MKHNHCKRLLADLIPPALVNLARRVRGGQTEYIGDFASWEASQLASGGYDSQLILAKVRDALLKVKNGEAVYERDSVLFDEVEYSWPLLAGLLWIASLNGNKLNLVDFGGSLGSTYYQNLSFLAHLPELRWSVVEQQNFVECGKQYFETDQVNFYNSLDECYAEQHPDTILLCSVLPYLEKPYELLQEIVARGFTYVILDRTPFLMTGEDRITVQKVPPQIYEASYPAWFLNEGKFLRFMEQSYELVAEFDALSGEIALKGETAHEKGFVFRKRV